MSAFRGVSFFQKLLLGYLAVGAFLVLGSTLAYYRIGVASIRSDIKSDIANELRLAVDYFNRSFGARLDSDLWFITSSPTIDAYLSSQKNELLMTRPAVETLFVRATMKNSDLWRSIRFVNPLGHELIVVEGNRRIRDLHTIDGPQHDIFGQRLHALFIEAKSSPPNTVLVSRPFWLGGHWGFLIGSPKVDPETHSFGGVVIIDCFLDEYLHHVGAMRYQNWPVGWVYTLDNIPLLSPRILDARDPNVFTFSETLRLGSDHHDFLKIVFHNAPEIFSDQFSHVALIGWTVGGGTMLVVVFLSFLMSRQFSKPLAELAHAADRLAAGDRSFHVTIGGGPELLRLATSFNQMIDDVQRTTVSKRYVDNILESMIDSLIVIDRDERITLVNPATYRLLNYSETDLIGQPASILFPDAAALQWFKEQVNKGLGFVSNAEREYQTKDGKRVPILFSMSVLQSSDKEVDGMVLLAQDITKRKHLEKLVLQSEKMSAVGQLAAGVAHEINNPLGVILGYMESVAGDMTEADSLWEPIAAVRREAIRCKTLVQNLLAFSRDRQPGFVPEQPETMVDNALALVEAQSRLKNITILREFAGPFAKVSMDRGQMEQVVINLCTNAMDAMPSGGRLTVSLSETPEWFEFNVTDTGTGIHPDIQQRIFEPFFSTKEIGKGTGLGLSLVFETVKKHNGELDVKSELQKGSTFTIRLPRRQLIQSPPSEK